MVYLLLVIIDAEVNVIELDLVNDSKCELQLIIILMKETV
jgi:hypothetical protein